MQVAQNLPTQMLIKTNLSWAKFRIHTVALGIFLYMENIPHLLFPHSQFPINKYFKRAALPCPSVLANF